MKNPLFLGFDVGTQSTKAVVVDLDRQQVLARATHPHAMVADLPPGHMEQRPEQWTDAVRATAREVVAQVDAAKIAGIGVSGQQHGAVVLDAKGAVVRPAKLWCDTATAAEAADLSRRLGRPIPTGYTASKLAWLAKHEPANWARARTVLLPHDYVNWWLTGEASMEFGDASGTGFFDAATRTFDAAAMAAIDPRLASLLPRLRPPGALAGRLTQRSGLAIGLDADVPVSAGGGDNMMSAIGSGATRDGVVVASLGTSGTIFTRTDRPIVDPRGLVAPFCSSDGAFLPLVCVMNATGVAEEVKALTGLDHGALTEAASHVAPGTDGLMVLPFLVGERVPDLPLATGTVSGLRPGLMTPGHLYRAALEGTSLNLAEGLDRLRALGVRVDEVRLAGGGAKNELWRQILADCFGVAVRVIEEPETAALGAALQAAWAVRRAAGERELEVDVVAAPLVRLGAEVTPRPEFAKAHAELRSRYRDLLARMHPGA